MYPAAKTEDPNRIGIPSRLVDACTVLVEGPHAECLLSARHCCQQRFTENISVLQTQLSEIDQTGDVFVQIFGQLQVPRA